MDIDLSKLQEKVIKKLKTLMTGMPQGLESADKVRMKTIQYNAAKTLLTYFQKAELKDPDRDNDDFDFPDTPGALKKHLAGLGDKLHADE